MQDDSRHKHGHTSAQPSQGLLHPKTLPRNPFGAKIMAKQELGSPEVTEVGEAEWKKRNVLHLCPRKTAVPGVPAPLRWHWGLDRGTRDRRMRTREPRGKAHWELSGDKRSCPANKAHSGDRTDPKGQHQWRWCGNPCSELRVEQSSGGSDEKAGTCPAVPTSGQGQSSGGVSGAGHGRATQGQTKQRQDWEEQRIRDLGSTRLKITPVRVNGNEISAKRRLRDIVQADDITSLQLQLLSCT